MTVAHMLPPNAAVGRRRSPTRLRFDAETFDRLRETVLSPDARYELIDGVIYAMSPTGDEHNSATVLLLRNLFQQFLGRVDILPSSSVRMDNWSVPQPDFVVFKRTYTAQELREHTIGPADCALVIEISFSSLRFDRQRKAPLYARVGIPEYWIVAIQEGVIEVHREPRPDGKGYALVTRHARGETVSPAAFPDAVIEGPMTVSPSLRQPVSTLPSPPHRGRGPAKLRFDVDMFVRFCASELPPDARVELIDGVIYQMSPTSPEHNGPSIALTRLLVQRLGDRADVLPSSSILLGRWSMPQPDFVVLAHHDDPNEYYNRHAEPADCLLVVEVSRSSLRFDRGVKARAYARAGVPEYWVVAVDEGVIEVHREPRSGGKGYASVVRVGRGEAVAPGALPDVRIGVDEVLGPGRG